MVKPVAILAVLLAFSFMTDSSQAEISPARQEQLQHMVRQDCGSCHGLTLKGGLGPALTGDALQEKDRQALYATIYFGRNGTPMPPFQSLLSDEEIYWIVDRLLKGDI